MASQIITYSTPPRPQNNGNSRAQDFAFALAVLQFIQSQRNAQAQLGIQQQQVDIEKDAARQRGELQKFGLRQATEQTQSAVATQRVRRFQQDAESELLSRKKSALESVRAGMKNNTAKLFADTLRRAGDRAIPTNREGTRAFIANVPERVNSILDSIDDPFQKIGAAQTITVALQDFQNRASDEEALTTFQRMVDRTLPGVLTMASPGFVGSQLERFDLTARERINERVRSVEDALQSSFQELRAKDLPPQDIPRLLEEQAGQIFNEFSFTLGQPDVIFPTETVRTGAVINPPTPGLGPRLGAGIAGFGRNVSEFFGGSPGLRAGAVTPAQRSDQGTVRVQPPSRNTTVGQAPPIQLQPPGTGRMLTGDEIMQALGVEEESPFPLLIPTAQGPIVFGGR